MTIIESLQHAGIRRVGSPKRGFRYRAPGNRAVGATDARRIRALKIPPAWSDVAIHPSPAARVQAVGKDAAGRWQYLYHESHVQRRERRKQERMIQFIEALPRMRRAVARDIQQPGISREKVLAGTLIILSTCFMRPGSKDYVDANGSYGIATLRRRHVTVRGDCVRFDFVGKAGKRHQRELRDRRLARLIRELLKHRGEVFKYMNPDGSLVDLRRRHINLYIKEVMGAPFSAKDFRTWAANLLCASALARRPSEIPASRTAVKRAITAALREVADHLGNTPAVCRASYVFPSILRSYERGRVIREPIMSLTSPASGRAPRLERTERALVELLRATDHVKPALRGRRAA